MFLSFWAQKPKNTRKSLWELMSFGIEFWRRGDYNSWLLVLYLFKFCFEQKHYYLSILQGLEQSKGKKACFGTHSLMITAHMQTTENNYSWLATTQNGHIFFETHLNNTNMITLFFLCKYGHMYVIITL